MVLTDRAGDTDRAFAVAAAAAALGGLMIIVAALSRLLPAGHQTR